MPKSSAVKFGKHTFTFDAVLYVKLGGLLSVLICLTAALTCMSMCTPFNQQQQTANYEARCAA